MFEWFLKTYSETSKDRLLEFMAVSDDLDHLSRMPQEDLALIYCERLVLNILSAHAPEKLNQAGQDVFKSAKKHGFK